MKQPSRIFALFAFPAITLSIALAPFAAYASEEGKRNTTIALGAASAALLLTQKNKLPGALVGAGAIYSYTQLDRDINRRHRRERRHAYQSGYRHGKYLAHHTTRHSVR